MKTPGIFIAVFAVYCICALCIGMGSATDFATLTVNHKNTLYAGPGHRLSPETIISNIEHEGVNVSDVKTAFRNGDNATVTTWLKTNRTAHSVVMRTGTGIPGAGLTNATWQQQIISHFRQKCVELTNATQTIRDGETGRGIAGRNLTCRTITGRITARLQCNKSLRN